MSFMLAWLAVGWSRGYPSIPPATVTVLCSSIQLPQDTVLTFKCLKYWQWTILKLEYLLKRLLKSRKPGLLTTLTGILAPLNYSSGNFATLCFYWLACVIMFGHHCIQLVFISVVILPSEVYNPYLFNNCLLLSIGMHVICACMFIWWIVGQSINCTSF